MMECMKKRSSGVCGEEIIYRAVGVLVGWPPSETGLRSLALRYGVQEIAGTAKTVARLSFHR